MSLGLEVWVVWEARCCCGTGTGYQLVVGRALGEDCWPQCRDSDWAVGSSRHGKGSTAGLAGPAHRGEGWSAARTWPPQ